jgi:RNA ligase (TIGR02306 family)
LAIKKPVPPEPQNWKQKFRERFWKEHGKIRSCWHLIRYNFIKTDPDFLRDLHSKTAAFYARRIKACRNKGVNENNIYWRAVKENDIAPGRLTEMFPGYPIFVLGEVYGTGVQDLDYGSTSNKPGFRVFDVFVGLPQEGRYLNNDELDQACKLMGLERVPVLYRGPFSMEKVAEYTSGNESVTGASKHIREGIVIRPTTERRDNALGRVQLKSVSEEYLTRKGGTEFN